MSYEPSSPVIGSKALHNKLNEATYNVSQLVLVAGNGISAVSVAGLAQINAIITEGADPDVTDS